MGPEAVGFEQDGTSQNVSDETLRTRIHEARGSNPLSSTNKRRNLAAYPAALFFSDCDNLVTICSRLRVFPKHTVRTLGILLLDSFLLSTWSFYWSCWHVGDVAVAAGHSYLV